MPEIQRQKNWVRFSFEANVSSSSTEALVPEHRKDLVLSEHFLASLATSPLKKFLGNLLFRNWPLSKGPLGGNHRAEIIVFT